MGNIVTVNVLMNNAVITSPSFMSSYYSPASHNIVSIIFHLVPPPTSVRSVRSTHNPISELPHSKPESGTNCVYLYSYADLEYLNANMKMNRIFE
jgi:hypothetical protein